MATIEKLDLKLDDIMSVGGTTVKSPVDIANNIQSTAQSNDSTLDNTKIMLSALGTIESFIAAAKAYETKVPGIAITLASLELGRQTALQDIEDYGNVQNATIFSMLSDISALTSQIGTVAKNPYIAGGGLVASVTLSTAALLSKEGDTSLATGIADFVVGTNNVLSSSETWQYGSATWLTAGTMYVIDKGTETDVFSWLANLGSDLKSSMLTMLDNLYEDIKGLFSSDEPVPIMTIGEITIDLSGYTVKGVDSNGNSFTQEVEKNSSGIIEKSTISQFSADSDLAFRRTTEYVGDNVKTSLQTYDTNGNIITKEIGLNNGASTYDFQLVSQSNQDLNKLFDREYEFKQFYALGGVDTSFYNYVTQQISDLIVSAPIIDVPNIYDGFDGLSLNPIGAFYESVIPDNDPALSITDKTFVLLDSTNKGITSTTLSIKDTNHDGKLTGTELSGLNMWRDLNENGVADTGEISTLSTQNITVLRSEDYGLHTKGNTLFSPAILSAPGHIDAILAITTKINKVVAVPASNFRTLRDTDNYYISPYGLIEWTSSQVKINYNNRTYMVGTDGNDTFDSNYYESYTQYFNSSLLVNFLAGGGNDLMGGSARNDNLWGGIGNDTLLGYAGDDELYGEEGDDELQGQVGNDTLDGGIGNDKLFGQVGNDTLNGGDGNDALSGFTASNDTKQTLLTGETDNDYLYGGAGTDTLLGGLGDDYLDGGTENDTLDGGAGTDILYAGLGNDLAFGGDGIDKVYGEEGIDELHGNAGNDYIDGGIGDDKLFGEVGDDTLVGGDGNDVLVGFTPTNDTKQTLAAGETDNDYLYGGNGLDNLYGGLGNDYLDGGADNDFLSGDEGNDTLFGGTGDDELQGGTGDDILSGDAGNDKLFGGVGNDTLYGGDGNDVLVGFTPSNDTKQTLSAGETDNDTIYAGNGDDFVLGGLGNDILFGEAGADELQGGEGNDMLYGGDGNDRLFGQVGDDVIYGGDGDDLIVGFTGVNETKQTLAAGESDNDYLYGGAGNDTLLGGLGNDYLDGGAGADDMEGGEGDDTYVVNSVNDTILEYKDEGYDTVISSSNYILNYGIEELRLVEGFDINGTGNALDNKIVGNSRNNIIDGVTGADTMIGEGGDDTYYVDNVGDQVIELAGEGTDTVQTTISYTLGENVENLILLDFSKAEKGLVDGEPILVYGYPKMNELDYMQGDAIPNFMGTCALTSIANLLTQVDKPTSEAEVVQVAIDNNWAVTDPSLPSYVRGGSNYVQQQEILDSYSIRNNLLMGYNENGIANLIKSGRGVIIALNAGVLWNDAVYVDNGGTNHVVTVTGAAYSETTGALMGFYIADSGRHKVSDMTRYVSIDLFREAANVPNAYAIYTIEPLKMWNEDIDGTGNALDNIITGNRGDNTLIGGAGNDTLNGGTGKDALYGGTGNDTYVVDSADDTVVENVDEGVDTVYASIDYTLGANVENLTLSGTANINATGNALNNTLIGNTGLNILDGGVGTDTMLGGAGDDTYVVDSIGDVVVENSNEGIDTVNSSISYTLSANVENLTLSGPGNINAMGNALNNIITGNRGDNTIIGGAGNDTLDGDSGKNTLYGGIGNDTYIIRSLDDTVFENTNEGNDIVQSSVTYTLNNNLENLTLIGTATINGTGNELNNALIGNSGNNILDGGLGADILQGGTGDDTYFVDNVGDIVFELNNEGIDTVISSSGVMYLENNLENLILIGTLNIQGSGNKANNILTGNSGLNVLDGEAGDDILFGGEGNDNLYGDEGNDILNGGEGNDYSVGGSGDDTINGDAGDDNLVGDDGNDILNGGSGNDCSLYDYIGDDIFNGGEGNDHCYDVVGDNILNGGSGNDSLYSGIGKDMLNGDEGDDLLFGGADDDILNGGSGNDDLVGEDGSDILNGGDGDDHLQGDQWLSDMWGNDVLNGGAGNDSLLGFGGEDILNGGAGDDYLNGNQGSDILNGDEGDDCLCGDVGDDELNGGSENDFLDGGIGNDTLKGGINRDALAGDGGNDTYYFNRGDGDDMVFDFIFDENYEYNYDNFDDPYYSILDSGNDTIQFGSSVGINDIAFFKKGNDLFLSYGDNDLISIINQSVTNNAIEKFTLADGNFLTSNDLNVIIQSMNSYATANDIAIETIDSVKANQDLMNIVAGAWHQ